MRYVNGVVLSILVLFTPMAALAGNLDSPAAPTDSASAMYTMQDVYNRVDDGTAGTKRPGAFTEPGAGPASTGKTLDDLYNLASERSRPAKTGQTSSYGTGSDGNLQKGVTWPSTRFTDNNNGTVTDNLTGLIWLKNANCTDTVGGVDKSGETLEWANALTWSNTLANGNCSLTDSSSAGDWRLPNVKELQSLIYFAFESPALSDEAGTAKWTSGHPFTNVKSDQPYWSSTTSAGNTDSAWFVDLNNGNVDIGEKSDDYYVWPVRGGQ